MNIHYSGAKGSISNRIVFQLPQTLLIMEVIIEIGEKRRKTGMHV